MKQTLTLGACLFAALLFSACSRTTDPILIGEYGSHSGSTTTFGVSTQNGILLAIQEANKNRGPRRPFQLVSIDDHGRQDDANKAVERLIQEGVVAILGEVASSRTAATIKTVEHHK